MIKLHEGGAYLIDGAELIPDTEDALAQVAEAVGRDVSQEEAEKNTIAYGILKAHNTSDNMEKLKIKFDKLTSHDITFVG
ncbi:MAG TPA: hydratase, partial [Lachnospiraceae bacterium]|nr:hydratase [Lachnospiraceae bacterium]